MNSIILPKAIASKKNRGVIAIAWDVEWLSAYNLEALSNWSEKFWWPKIWEIFVTIDKQKQGLHGKKK